MRMKSSNLINILQIAIVCLFVIWSVLLIYSYDNKEHLETRAQNRKLKSLDQRVQLPPDDFIDDTTFSSFSSSEDQTERKPKTTVIHDDIDSSEVITGQPVEIIPLDVSPGEIDGTSITTTATATETATETTTATATIKQSKIEPSKTDKEISSSFSSSSTDIISEVTSSKSLSESEQQITTTESINYQSSITQTGSEESSKVIPKNLIKFSSQETSLTESFKNSSLITEEIPRSTTFPSDMSFISPEDTHILITTEPSLMISEETPSFISNKESTFSFTSESETENTFSSSESNTEASLSSLRPQIETNQTESIEVSKPVESDIGTPQVSEKTTEANVYDIPITETSTSKQPKEEKEESITERVTNVPESTTERPPLTRPTTELNHINPEGITKKPLTTEGSKNSAARPQRPTKTYAPSYNGWFYRYVPAKIGGGGTQSYWYHNQNSVGSNRIDLVHPTSDKMPTAMDIQGALERELQRRKSIQYWLLQSLYQYSNTMANEIITVSKLMQTNRFQMDQTTTSSTMTELQRLNRMLLFTNEYLQKLARFQEYDGLLSSS